MEFGNIERRANKKCSDQNLFKDFADRNKKIIGHDSN